MASAHAQALVLRRPATKDGRGRTREGKPILIELIGTAVERRSC